MGACISMSLPIISRSVSIADAKPSAHVVSLNGDLRQYDVPVKVSEVLQSEATSSSSSSSSSPNNYAICNSDGLYFDHYIPSLKAEDELEAGQIYFVLPKTKLQYKLSASDMAALAVKASVAIEKITTAGGGGSSRGRKNKKKKARISPIILDVQEECQQMETINSLLPNKQISSINQKGSGLGVSRSGSVRKLQRYSSKRAKLAVRSFRLKLSTIYEGSVLQFN